MCFFPRSNPEAIKNPRLVSRFDCGYCPECLSKKAKIWALRSSMQAKIQDGCMVTLTYDDYIRDSRGQIIGERVSDKNVDKSDCQKFIKRLRKHFPDIKIKYLLSAEYGKRTHRAHYHALLFGVQFPDLVRYKRSKRGNIIYKSATLYKIWKHGICTVDSISINGKCARYCTKYAMKDSGADDTFMLFSRGIGDDKLLQEFNGKSYIIDGIEYPIPKLIWNKIIVDKFKNNYIFQKFDCTYKYRSLRWFMEKYPPELAYFMSDFQKRKNKIFSNFKRAYKPFQRYLSYWNDKAKQFELLKGSNLNRLLSLDVNKYFNYKIKALEALILRRNGRLWTIPRSKLCVTESFIPKRYICPNFLS